MKWQMAAIYRLFEDKPELARWPMQSKAAARAQLHEEPKTGSDVITSPTTRTPFLRSGDEMI